MRRLRKRHIRFEAVSEEAIRRDYEKAVEDFKKYHREAARRCASIEEIPREEAFPDGVPSLRVEEEVLGSRVMRGASMSERIDGVHSVITISREHVVDPYLTSLHELSHVWGSQHGLDINERDANCIAREISIVS